MKAVAHKNFRRSALRGVGILSCAIGRAKNVTVSESREIARVTYLVQITNIGSSHAGKERSREGQDISMSDWAREKTCRCARKL